MKQVILILIQKVFFGDYPDEWNNQILHSITKSGHTKVKPKLRGIAIAPLLCRVYDTIIDQRFNLWYMPNYQQAGFRPGQGCLLQIFSLVLLIIYSKEMGKNLFVGFMDFEKAFDYTNRANIISDLMRKGCGKYLTRAIAKMYVKTLYSPKIDENNLGRSISTRYGVTQGRKSSIFFLCFGYVKCF